ncbi:protoporphyrinogen oxidase [Pseudonocardia sp. H11422]|uniref:protoporphyrinogen oxidase n=1 Tax=Pseudonocardia sp. H11422 TaxID=2835866 RepID=UPI001BDD2643|nr:protoporphyrinogen oxidase [Pseudonocardia sp. H11422]
MDALRIAVVGAGVSGLAAAHRLRVLLGPAAEITVLERSDRIGGVLRTVELAGVPYDVGAEAFLARRPEILALLDELGLREQIVHPTSAAPSVRAGGRTVGLPGGTLLGVPTGAARLDGVLSPAGLAAVAAEPARDLHWEPGGDVALGGLLRDRFGDELADRIADPLLGGVYAGRVDALGLRATIPTLAAALDAGAPSLTAAADAATATPPPASRGIPARESGSERARVAPSGRVSCGLPASAGPVFGALRGGYRVLLDTLAAAAGADMRLGTTVRSLERTPTGWRLTLGPATASEALDVDAVLLAVPAPAVRRLLADVSPTAAAAAGEIELASSVVVALAYREADTASLPSTSGALIAAGEPLSIKGATHSSNKWGHLAAGATDGLVRLRTSLGRFGEAAELQVDDAALVARARADLATLTGITAAPVAVHVQRWGGGLPQYAVGHDDRVRTIENMVAGLPRLAVAGSALHGVGVPACVGTARAAAERVGASLAPLSGRDSRTG